jgi:hypothetical protein
MIALGLVLLAASAPGGRFPPAPYIDVSEAREAIAPHVSRIKSCRQTSRDEVICLVVRHRKHESARAVNESSYTTKIKVTYTPGWSYKPAS